MECQRERERESKREREGPHRLINSLAQTVANHAIVVRTLNALFTLIRWGPH